MSPNATLLAPSILAADHADLTSGLKVVQSSPAQWLHLDIMDGNFVPNLSFGPKTVEELRKRDSTLFFDTHLMLARPDRFIDAFADAGSNGITIHVEPEYDIAATLSAIRKKQIRPGIALNPGTSPEAVFPFLKDVDLVLVMTVWPGFGGQSFIEETLSHMRCLSKWRNEQHLSFRLEVDGGINLETARRCKAEGVDTLVAGTSFFKADDPAAFCRQIELSS